MKRTDFFVERTDYFMERSDHWLERSDHQTKLPITVMPTYQTTDEQIKIFVTENTESDTFYMEEYSEKYTIVICNPLWR